MFDEADLLLSGGYGAQMRIIWDALRACKAHLGGCRGKVGIGRSQRECTGSIRGPQRSISAVDAIEPGAVEWRQDGLAYPLAEREAGDLGRPFRALQGGRGIDPRDIGALNFKR